MQRKNGELSGIKPADVVKVFEYALRHLPPQFTRQQLRAVFDGCPKPAVPSNKLTQLEYAFFRTVCPESLGEGLHQLPTQAKALVRHRRFKLPAGRYGLADTMQLTAILRSAEQAGVRLTPRLAALRKRGVQALKMLDAPLDEMHRSA